MNLIQRVSQLGTSDTDDRATRTRKTTLVLTTVIAATIVIPWGMFYMAIGLPRAGAIPLVYSAVSFAAIAHFAKTHDDTFLRYEQTTLLLVLPVLVHIALGGFVTSSGVAMYTIIGIVGALTFASPKRPWYWFGAYAVLMLLLVPLDSTFRRWAPDLSDEFIATFLAVNMLTTALIVFMSMAVYRNERHRLAAELAEERKRSEDLLLNVLPASIATRLIDGETTIADRYDEIGVLFADIVDFTPLSERLSADDLVDGLNGLFSVFDELALNHGVEKVKTMGDSYMVISGAPERGTDMVALASLALDMRDAAADVSIGDRNGVDMRFGMDVGPGIAGVIGESKFIYDVYGDTVNMASRMESHGEPNRIQITERAADQLRSRFDITERGTIDIKGKGMATTYFLNGPAV